jgi:hypothetical protein
MLSPDDKLVLKALNLMNFQDFQKIIIESTKSMTCGLIFEKFIAINYYIRSLGKKTTTATS